MKVLIPTAGVGSRLGGLTEHFNKALLPIGRRPVISHIIDWYPPGTRFVVALGYKGDHVRQYLELAYPSTVFEFVDVPNYDGPGSGLGLTLKLCRPHLDEPFMFHANDSIVVDRSIRFPLDADTMFLHRGAADPKRYRTVSVERFPGSIERAASFPSTGERASFPNTAERASLPSTVERASVPASRVIGVHDKSQTPVNGEAFDYIGVAYIHDHAAFCAHLDQISVEIGESDYFMRRLAERPVRGPAATGREERPVRGPAAAGREERPVRGPAAAGREERPVRGPAATGRDERPVRGPAATDRAQRPIEGLAAADVQARFVEKWYDIGNVEQYRAALSDLSDFANLNKPDEAIYFHGSKVFKFSTDSEFIRRRVERAAHLTGCVPQVCAQTANFYAYNHVPGRLLADEPAPATDFEALLEWCGRTIWQPVRLTQSASHAFENTCFRFYYDKTMDRIDAFYSRHDFVDRAERINGVESPPLAQMLERVDWPSLKRGVPVLFHGDLHLENILRTDGGFALLDWRQGFGDEMRYGDLYYDLAKLLHGLIVNHEIIRSEQFTIEHAERGDVVFDFHRRHGLIACERLLRGFVDAQRLDWGKVSTLTALVYLNIAPLHHYPYSHLLYYLGKAMLREMTAAEPDRAAELRSTHAVGPTRTAPADLVQSPISNLKPPHSASPAVGASGATRQPVIHADHA
jgi:hypothetical protein